MKINNREKVRGADKVIQNDRNIQTYNKRRKISESNSSSDFSQFQLNSKFLKKQDDEFSPFSKPNYWQLNEKQSKGRKLKESARENSKQRKINNQKQQKQKKIRFQKPNGQHTISFKKSLNESSAQNKQVNKQQQQLRNIGKLDDESLIQQYDKAQFNNKTLRRECEQYNKNIQRSRCKQNERQILQTGLIKTRGGLCFEIDKTGFFCEHQNKPKKRRRAKGKSNKNKGVQNGNEQILKRRQLAFRYGEIIRRRTFGYY